MIGYDIFMFTNPHENVLLCYCIDNIIFVYICQFMNK